jgi:biotin carboxyl carrier protein
VLQDFILRATPPAKAALAFSLGADGSLALPGEPAAKIKILRRDPGGQITLLWGDKIVSGIAAASGERSDTLIINFQGGSLSVTLREAPLDAMEQGVAGPASNGGCFDITSPIPGLVKALPVKAGDTVAAGQTLIVLEAMKMENEIVAPHAGKIDTLSVATGQVVAAGAHLVRLKLD